MHFEDVKLGDLLHDMRLEFGEGDFPCHELSQPHRVEFSPPVRLVLTMSPERRHQNWQKMVETMIEMQHRGKVDPSKQTTPYCYLAPIWQLIVVGIGEDVTRRHPALLVTSFTGDMVRFGTVTRIPWKD